MLRVEGALLGIHHQCTGKACHHVHHWQTLELKNVLAIAAGIVEGMNLGNNCMTALVAQGCSGIRWLAEKVQVISC
ncbi:hypothetical protein KP509_04G001000 [Ceratopteris richardii]|uniref:Glycerol-3-phosphate dehydrogenase NAD-dependent C-terminal domain-containing protein n=1 Tax=Ceratopteris richardii TaxID=49495 RepID=A0A8T2UX96_CERRI|nr:hypothetical protein KP509_04G001000 [Ceratopteris richardii]KAH7438095.1 hypothetical protein KP509_04G001000 [Ceratopteris richardii]